MFSFTPRRCVIKTCNVENLTKYCYYCGEYVCAEHSRDKTGFYGYFGYKVCRKCSETRSPASSSPQEIFSPTGDAVGDYLINRTTDIMVKAIKKGDADVVNKVLGCITELNDDGEIIPPLQFEIDKDKNAVTESTNEVTESTNAVTESTNEVIESANVVTKSTNEETEDKPTTNFTNAEEIKDPAIDFKTTEVEESVTAADDLTHDYPILDEIELNKIKTDAIQIPKKVKHRSYGRGKSYPPRNVIPYHNKNDDAIHHFSYLNQQAPK